MKAPFKNDRTSSLIGRLTAEYIARETAGIPLITVTRTLISDDRKYVTIQLTVFPENAEVSSLKFIEQRAVEIRDYIEEHARMGHVPFLRFALDQGEKNRQKIEELSSKDLPRGAENNGRTEG